VVIDDIFGPALRQVAPLLVFFALALGALAVFKARLGGAGSGAVGFPYARRAGLFSEAEARFLRVLREAAPDLDVFGKVRLEDVVAVKKGLPKSEWLAARNRIKSRHLDFVLVEPDSTRVVCVVELDDASHASERARRSDAVKDGALAAAGVPLLRVPARGSYDASELRRRVEAAVIPAEAAAD